MNVTGIDSLNDYYDRSLKLDRLAQIAGRARFSFYRVDLADRDRVAELFDRVRPDVVIHLAAQAGVRHSLANPHAYVDANVTGFLNVLEGCRRYRVGHLLYASSSYVYGGNTKVPFSEDDPVCDPRSLYAATKRANELMAQTYAHLFQIPASGLRFFTVYGPWGRPDMAYFQFTKAIMAGVPIDLYNDGHMSRDFTYIDDVVEAVIRLIDVPPAGHEIYNVGNSAPVVLSDFVAEIENAVGREAVCRYLPMQPGDVPATYASVDKLAKAVGFSPSTPLEDGIRRFVAWYKDYYRNVEGIAA